VFFIIRENKHMPGHTFVGESMLMDGEASALLRDRTAQEEVFILVRRFLQHETTEFEGRSAGQILQTLVWILLRIFNHEMVDSLRSNWDIDKRSLTPFDSILAIWWRSGFTEKQNKRALMAKARQSTYLEPMYKVPKMECISPCN
jgi:hypothetical protein